MTYRGSQGPDETRNLIIAGALSVVIFLGFEFFYNIPQERHLAEQRAHAAQQQQQAAHSGTATAPAVAPPAEQVLAATSNARVAIDTPSLDGSISLQGARFDNLNLRQYRRTLDRNSGEVTLLSPYNAQHGYDAFLGWEDRNGSVNAQGACERNCGVGANDLWRAEGNGRLTPQTPVTLTYAEPNGLQIRRTIAIDQNYMFTITDEVRNAGADTRTVRPFGVVRRLGLPADYINRGIVQQGYAGAFGEHQRLQIQPYQKGQEHARDRDAGKVPADSRIVEASGQGGWMGISDHYWLGALIPDQHEQVDGYYDSRTEGTNVDFRATYRGQWRDVAPGASVTYTQRVFAGAKRVDLLQAYQRALNIPRFDEAVDWGTITWILSRTFFLWLIHPLAQWVAGLHMNLPAFGIAILLSTIVIKALAFPLVYSSFKSMGKMRGLIPKQKEIQERYAADPQRAQQEILKLYQAEKVNPVAGCIPQLLMIPVFFALYKTLSVTIEMRQAPFFGWIHDLSAQDPTTIFNLFGLLPFNPHDIPLVGPIIPLIGVWPLMYGVSMLALQSLSPPPTDATQAQIFRLMPIMFTFLFASFPAGLVIYWTWSNLVTIVQQYVIMRRQGTETQFDKLIAKYLRREPAAAE